MLSAAFPFWCFYHIHISPSSPSHFHPRVHSLTFLRFLVIFSHPQNILVYSPIPDHRHTEYLSKIMIQNCCKTPQKIKKKLKIVGI